MHMNRRVHLQKISIVQRLLNSLQMSDRAQIQQVHPHLKTYGANKMVPIVVNHRSRIQYHYYQYDVTQPITQKYQVQGPINVQKKKHVRHQLHTQWERPHLMQTPCLHPLQAAVHPSRCPTLQTTHDVAYLCYAIPQQRRPIQLRPCYLATATGNPTTMVGDYCSAPQKVLSRCYLQKETQSAHGMITGHAGAILYILLVWLVHNKQNYPQVTQYTPTVTYIQQDNPHNFTYRSTNYKTTT